MTPNSANLEKLLAEVRACRYCVSEAVANPLPHEPRPVLQASLGARLAVCSQAPGTKVHASGRPFTDRSGDRLREWMGVTPDVFYDERRVTIIPMGFCFPGQDAKGGDLPPRRECASLWHAKLFDSLPKLELILAIGSYAQRWHLGPAAGKTLQETMLAWRTHLSREDGPPVLPLPHPSWRNNAWLKKNPWFEAELLPVLRAKVRALVSDGRASA
ncbi:uracil-DNA glycosylase family protein [Methyloligella sp. 2.7D]|uniref:uracil-DNA glycosylase family protein n=1 Tax=unclassified Methyloligella TaxID=2625955 RepID=UPI00157C0613|nr:uracil-DNA glycosylase family protein [Methyloligella sp. GL2]QKP77167.1 uracil-DNA glycosylase family protein [Methyloligella sp. GL2]